jgi:two-component system cell cycle response regulator
MDQTFPSTIRVVIIDDDDVYCDYLKSLLDKIGTFEVSYANDSTSAMAFLANNTVDCVIMDYDLGTENGISIGQLINTKYSDPPPIVMLSGHAKERVIVMAFRGGFSDVVMKKGLTPDELIGAVRGAVDRKLRDRAERSERVRLARLSSFDGLTGLRTADFMKERSRELTASAIRRRGQCAAILVRPRELESVSDTFGYHIRDRALHAFARRLQNKSRTEDICGQYAEGSFLYMIDRDPTPQSVIALCDRLYRDLAFPVNLNHASFNLTAVLGAAVFPDSGETLELLLEAAGRALAQAHSSGMPFVLAPEINPEPESAKVTAPQFEAFAANENSYAEPALLAGRTRDRRCDKRHRVLKRGRICLPGIDSVLDCAIRDISSNGARLRLLNYCLLPDQFDLIVVDTGQKRPVAVRWRLGTDFGVQFLAE